MWYDDLMDLYKYLDEIFMFLGITLLAVFIYGICSIWKPREKLSHQSTSRKFLFTAGLLIVGLVGMIRFIAMFFAICFKQCY